MVVLPLGIIIELDGIGTLGVIEYSSLDFNSTSKNFSFLKKESSGMNLYNFKKNSTFQIQLSFGES